MSVINATAYERVGLPEDRYDRAHFAVITRQGPLSTAELLSNHFDLPNQDGSTEGLNLGVEALVSALYERIIPIKDIPLKEETRPEDSVLSKLLAYSQWYIEQHWPSNPEGGQYESASPKQEDTPRMVYAPETQELIKAGQIALTDEAIALLAPATNQGIGPGKMVMFLPKRKELIPLS